MRKISDEKDWRRARLAALLKKVKATKLAALIEGIDQRRVAALLRELDLQLTEDEVPKISAAFLYQMASGKGTSRRNVNDIHARLIEEAAGKPPGWLDWDGDTQPEFRDSPHAVERVPIEKGLRKLPIVGSVSLGFGQSWLQSDFNPSDSGGYVEHYTQDQTAYALRIKGDSFFPAIRNGHMLIVHPNDDPVVDEMVVLNMKDGRIIISNLRWHRDGEYALESVNGESRFTLDEKDVESVHPVKGTAPPSMKKL